MIKSPSATAQLSSPPPQELSPSLPAQYPLSSRLFASLLEGPKTAKNRVHFEGQEVSAAADLAELR
jgi:hypothetical protein